MQLSGNPVKILVVRPDKLGDVVLSTPVFEVLKRQYPRSRITVLVREFVAPLVRGLDSVDDVLIYDPRGRHAGFSGFLRLIADIRERSFRIGVILHSERRITAALFAAGVRHRIGPLSKPHSFLFLNRGVRQKRSEVEMHEADYNLQLLRRLGLRVPSRTIPVRVHVTDAAGAEAGLWLRDRGWAPESPGSNVPKLVFVHPGMAGSALNWPEDHYVELIAALLDEGRFMVVTGGPSEAPLLKRVREAVEARVKRLARIPKFSPAFYGGERDVSFLAGLYSHADAVIAPSTGPLHIAVALGKKVVTFYSPIKVQSVLRWGPYLADEARARVIVPEGYCGQDFECRGNLCNYFPCMKSISVVQALEQVNGHLAERVST